MLKREPVNLREEEDKEVNIHSAELPAKARQRAVDLGEGLSVGGLSRGHAHESFMNRISTGAGTGVI